MAHFRRVKGFLMLALPAAMVYHVTWISLECGSTIKILSQIPSDVASASEGIVLPSLTPPPTNEHSLLVDHDIFQDHNHHHNKTTIVSAFYPLKSKHSVSHYSYWMEILFSLQDNMVIFTSSKGYPTVKAALAKSQNASTTNTQHPHNHTSNVTIVVLELPETNTAQMFNSSLWQQQHEKDPERRIHKTYEIYWVWLGKPEFLKRAIAMNPYQAQFFAWVDIGYFRERRWSRTQMLQHIPTNLALDQILLLDVNFKTNRTPLVRPPWPKPASKAFTVGAGFIGGYVPGILRWHDLFFDSIRHRYHEFIGKEQAQMYRACFLAEDMCLLVRQGNRSYGDKWFFMAPYMILGETETQARTWIPSIDRIDQPYHAILEPPASSG